jgi:23S rRNA (adenine2503-C2)-methyltransferase
MCAPAIKDLPDDRLRQWLAAHGQPAFRLRQILHWLYAQWATSFADMHTLPADLREALAADFRAFSLDLADSQQADDGTCKWLFRLGDGQSIETVLVRAPERLTVCVSTQVGCPVQCTFCASGRGGLVRNLQPAEIVDQIIAASRQAGQRVDNVVVMGMGEPLLNLAALVPALALVCAPDRFGLGARHITISTSGIVPGIRQLADQRGQWHLALSLHAVTDTQRARLIPDRYRYPLKEVLAACRHYRERSGRIVTLEYALIAGINDADADAKGLAAIARDLDAKVNLIPCNLVSQRYTAPDARRLYAFEAQLRHLGAKVTVRQRKGERIQAACGQLRRRPGALSSPGL